MVDSTSAVAVVAKEDGKERRKEKERKKRSPETLDLAPADVGGAPNRRKGRDVLLKSIAAFLDTNGFSKTLSVFQSEAQLEIGCWKSSFVDLGDLFCKVLDSSNGYKEAGINWLPDQDAQKVGFSREIEDNAAENTHKKRKKIDQIDDGIPTEVNKTQMDKGFGEGINDGEKPAADGLQDKLKKTKAVGSGFEVLSADNASLSSSNLKEMTTLNENSDLKKSKLAEDLHLEPKEKKKKKKKVSDTTIEKDINTHLEVGCLTAEGTDPASQLPEPIEKRKEKKKKCKVMREIHDDIAEPSDSEKLKEMVNNKIEEMVSLTKNSLESSMKHKSENKKDKKLKQVAAEASKDTSEVIKDVKLVGVEGHTGCVSKNPSDDNDSQHKAKKKKQKSTPDVGTTVNSDQAGEEKSAEKMKECDINHDAGASNFGHENVPVSEDMNIKVSKRTSKKRKALDSGGKADNDISGIESKVKPKGADNEEKIGIVVKSDRSSLDNVTSVPTKKRKTEESKEKTKNAGEQLEVSNKSKENGNASNTKNEVVGDQMANGSTGNNSAKGKRSEEPKSVNPFQRVKMGHVKFADDRLKDNSYWAKDGADIGYGAKAQEVLGQVRGRDFKHEKTKKKRGSYRGGRIDLQSHSIKFSYSDDE